MRQATWPGIIRLVVIFLFVLTFFYLVGYSAAHTKHDVDPEYQLCIDHGGSWSNENRSCTINN